MKNHKKTIVCLLCVLLILPLISCNPTAIKDPLASSNEEPRQSTTSSVPSELPENEWAPLISEDEALQSFGLGSREDTVGASIRSRKCYGEFVYYRGTYSFKSMGGDKSFPTLLRYDMSTGTSEPACRDAACTHQKDDCPFAKPEEIKNFLMDDGVLYFLRVKLKSNGKIDTSKKGGIYSYNLKTLEYKYLCDWEGCDSTYLNLYEGAVYFIQYEFHTNDNGYDRWVFACDINSGKTEKLFCYGNETDTIFKGRYPVTIDEKGRFIFRNIRSDYIPLEIKEVDVVFECAELKKNAEFVTLGKETTIHFDSVTLQGFVYADSKIYYPEYVKQVFHSVIVNGQTTEVPLFQRSVRCLDLTTGETETVAENVAGGFTLGGKYLYYTPYKYKKVSYPNGDNAVFATYGEVIQVNLETGEERTFKVDENIEICGSGQAYYYRGRLFNYINDAATGSSYDAEIDLSTGKYRKVVTELVSIS